MPLSYPVVASKKPCRTFPILIYTPSACGSHIVKQQRDALFFFVFFFVFAAVLQIFVGVKVRPLLGGNQQQVQLEVDPARRFLVILLEFRIWCNVQTSENCSSQFPMEKMVGSRNKQIQVQRIRGVKGQRDIMSPQKGVEGQFYLYLKLMCIQLSSISVFRG